MAALEAERDACDEAHGSLDERVIPQEPGAAANPGERVAAATTRNSRRAGLRIKRFRAAALACGQSSGALGCGDRTDRAVDRRRGRVVERRGQMIQRRPVVPDRVPDVGVGVAPATTATTATPATAAAAVGHAGVVLEILEAGADIPVTEHLARGIRVRRRIVGAVGV